MKRISIFFRYSLNEELKKIVQCIETEIKDEDLDLVQQNENGESVVYVGFSGFDDEGVPQLTTMLYYVNEEGKLDKDEGLHFFNKPKTAEELLKWQRSHKDKLEYSLEIAKSIWAEIILKKQAFDDEKANWIYSFGSEELKRNFEQGYDVDEDYIFERLVYELPEFDLYDGSGRWAINKNPSREALVEVKKLRYLGYDAKVIIISKQYEEFGSSWIPIDAKDAILIEDYLGVVSLIKYL